MPTNRTWTALGLMLVAPILMTQGLAAQSLAAQAVADPGQASQSQSSQSQASQNQPSKAVSKSATPAVHHHKAHKKPAPLVLPPMPQGPLSQLPMDQIPATPAKVSFQNGLLSISAQNSTLGEILREVRKLTGASIDIPPGAGANERVVVHLGPGTPRDVLSGLLNGSSFNYVMLGSNTEPGAVATVLLTARPSVAGEVQTAANNTNMSVYQNGPAAPMPPMRFPGPGGFNQQNLAAAQQANGQQAAADADDKDDDAADADDKDDKDDKDEDQAQPVQAGPGQSTDSADANGQVQPDPNAGPKTPEQIMEMLRRSQQQQPGMPGPAQQPPQQ
jgi:hypothetical protein